MYIVFTESQKYQINILSTNTTDRKRLNNIDQDIMLKSIDDEFKSSFDENYYGTEIILPENVKINNSTNDNLTSTRDEKIKLIFHVSKRKFSEKRFYLVY